MKFINTNEKEFNTKSRNDIVHACIFNLSFKELSSVSGRERT